MIYLSKNQIYNEFKKVGFRKCNGGIAVQDDVIVVVNVVKLKKRMFIELSILDKSENFLGSFQLDGPNSPWSEIIRSEIYDLESVWKIATFCKNLARLENLLGSLSNELRDAGIVSERLKNTFETLQAAPPDRRSEP